MVQRPEIKVSVALLIRGEQGAGKGVVQEILRKILGRTHSSYFVNLSQMLGQYNGEFLEKCVLGIVDEVTLDKGFDYSKIKALITEDTHTIELKYVAPYVVDNYTAFMFFSNHEHVMRLEPGDRRFVVLEAASTYAGPETAASAAYFDHVRGVWLEAVSAHVEHARPLQLPTASRPCHARHHAAEVDVSRHRVQLVDALPAHRRGARLQLVPESSQQPSGSRPVAAAAQEGDRVREVQGVVCVRVAERKARGDEYVLAKDEAHLAVSRRTPGGL